jgi:yecA family protein
MEEIYEPINKSLAQVGSIMNAAEAHGLLCGFLCHEPTFSPENWLKQVLGETAIEDGLTPECQKQLLLVKDYTLEQLNSPYCDFKPLLPPDEEAVSQRVQALAGWCEGFLFALGLNQLDSAYLSDNAEEFLQDMISISRLAPCEDVEESEIDYVQLLEYVRMGVLILYEELFQRE